MDSYRSIVDGFDPTSVGVRDLLAARLMSNAGPRGDNWFRIENKAEARTADLFIYDEIGYFGTTAAEFGKELQALNVEQIDVHINSVGGSVFDGIAIYNALRTHDAKVTTQVDSAALSIASVIAQAGDTRTMVSGSQMMIHEAHGMALGFAGDMREMADLLDKQTGIIAGIYAERSGEPKAGFDTLMRASTWLDADETVAAGLADDILIPSKTDDTETTNFDPGLEQKEAERRRQAFVDSAQVTL
jgi:ATP-dependent protease ClpP protease subunit